MESEQPIPLPDIIANEIVTEAVLEAATGRELALLGILTRYVVALEDTASHLEVRGQHQTMALHGHSSGRCETCQKVSGARELIVGSQAEIDRIFEVSEDALG